MGCSLARYFSERNVTVSGLFGRSGVPEGFCRFKTIDEVFFSSDVILVTVTDSAIAGIWNGSDKDAFNNSNKILCHCSGSLSSEIFTGADPQRICSVHPMLAFPSKNVPETVISTAFFTIEGGNIALKAVRRILDICGNTYREILPECKVKYHAAACFASNFMTAVCAQAFSLMNQCGFSEEEARSALSPLILGNAENICRYGIKPALTGPMSRGDALTVNKHMAELDGRLLEVYKLLSEELAYWSGHEEILEIT